MSEKSDSVKVGPLVKDCDVKIGQGYVAFKKGWSGRVKREAYDVLLEKGALPETEPVEADDVDESGAAEGTGDVSETPDDE